MSSIAHLQTNSSSSLRQVQDSAEAMQGGAQARLTRAKLLVTSKKTPIPAQQSSKPLQSSSAPTIKSPAAKQANAAEQIDDREKAIAVATKGVIKEKDFETLGRNQKIFKKLTSDQDGFMEMHIKSLVSSLTEETRPRSLIDASFNSESLEKRAFLKVVLIETALQTPDNGLSEDQVKQLKQERNNLYNRFGEYIEIAKLAIDTAESVKHSVRISTKQLAKAFQLFSNAKESVGSDLSFIRIIATSNTSDLKTTLLNMEKHFINLSKTDNIAGAGSSSNLRHYFIQSKINQVRMAIKCLIGIEEINKLVSKVSSMAV
jgi:hypothetical protein